MTSIPLPPDPAINDYATRQGLAQYRRRAWPRLLIALGLAAWFAQLTAAGDFAHKGDGRGTMILLGLIAVGTLAGGVGTLVIAARMQRVLSREAWRSYDARFLPPKRRAGLLPKVACAGMVLTHEGRSSSRKLIEVRDGPRRVLKISGEPVVWLCGDPASRAVIASPATRTLFYAARPRRGYFGRVFWDLHESELAALSIYPY